MVAADDVPPFDPAQQRAWRVGSMHGLPRRYVDSPEWSRPTRGVRLWLPPSAREPDDRIFTAAAILPTGSGLGGWAAIWLHGVGWVDGRARDGSELRVPVVVPPTSFVPRRPGFEFRRSALEPADLEVIKGVPVTSGVRTAFDAARWSTSLGDAVAYVDALLRANATDLPSLDAYVAAHAGWVGVGRARQAVRRANGRSRSPQESRLRVQWFDAGLPEPLVNVNLWTPDGDLLGEADLLDPESGFVAEYDGWMHRQRDRRELDHGRARRFADAGVTMRTYVDRDLAGDPRALHASLRAGHAAARSVTRRFWTLDPDPFWE